ncbi:hypothetical protein JX265_011329 [Neoarthrinium moseri]|uniref:Multiple RNA-binding domain-containing protein 1 n=1 Tax=Neoarthrinium moseri TaxID=1658444 RepID=A0A9Q0AJS1_9PEZI|nr:hypothetical protein JX266_009020 [Neoarthrinium moseri]KAI1857128.1 hypothetical protein JX265_011329 [Neoarthrinium moseri]
MEQPQASQEESSRIFVRNLPPTITEPEFRKHFSHGSITDIKLIPQRRIGYVGFKTPDEAKKAVKLFHRSFIRMSKIAVELARPILDPALYKARQAHNTSHTPPLPTSKAPQATSDSSADPAQKKRKRDDLDEADPKLQEFLEVMHPGNYPAKKVREEESLDAVKPLVVTDGDSDGEYEEVPSRKLKGAEREPMARNEELSTQIKAPTGRVGSDPDASDSAGLRPESGAMDLDMPSNNDDVPGPATDDDWLRSRTNRLLDLVEDDEGLAALSRGAESAPAPAQDIKASEPVPVSEVETRPEADAGEDAAAEHPRPRRQEPKEDSILESIRNTSRIYVRNLPYSATSTELREFFAKFGEIEEIHVPSPRGSTNNNQGFAFISYVEPDHAVEAFQRADGATFQGRMIHIIPGSAKRVQQLDEYTLSKLPLKEQNRLRKKAKAGSAFNWNSLYMNQDAVLNSTADRLGVSKSELLDPTNADAAVKQALAETSTIQDTKAYFIANGVDLDSFKSAQRSDTIILVKNFPYGTSIEELRTEFQEHGQVLRVLMPPTGTIAIVHFANAAEAKTAFGKLAYRRFKNSILFLEKGPKTLFVEGAPQETSSTKTDGKQKLSAEELMGRGVNEEPEESSSLFVKNLSFNTNTAQLHEAFKHLDGYRSASVKTKTDPKKPGQVLSMGFGFVAFSNKASAEAAAQSMDGQVLHGHKLLVRTSHGGQDAAEQRRKEDAAKKAANRSTKIILKNLPFEATKKDIRTLMGTYGQLRTVRLPKNVQNRSKGYAFCEFVTSREAENAMAALKDTHLLGRKLVLEFAEAEAVDAEEVIAKMTKKTGSQNAKVSLHQLIGGDRKKITLGDEEEGEGDF